VCFFLGTWNSGSTLPGKPYVAKWPDKYGHVNQRDIICPDCIGNYFAKSNTIDIGNQLRQNESGLERCWCKRDPRFWIASTVIGITVVDAFLLAQFSAPSCAKLTKMSAQDFAMHTVKDMWTYKISHEPRSEIVGRLPYALNGQGIHYSNNKGPLSFQDITRQHYFRKTSQREVTTGDIVRRTCHMKAAGC
jgi:hypothetical protein